MIVKYFKNLTLAVIAGSFLAGCHTTIDITYDASVADYTPIVTDILKAHPKGNVTIRFGNGTYPFFPEKADVEFINVSNNDSGEKRVGFLLKNMKNVSIVGENTDFMFHGSMMPFALKESENIEIKGISIDYDYPWTFEAEVLSNKPAERSFIVKVFPDNKYRIDGDRLLFSGYDWEYPMGESIVFNPSTHRPWYDTAAYDHWYWSGEMKAREIEPGIIEFTRLSARDVPPVGSIWDDKGPTRLNRLYPAIAVLCSKNVTLEQIHVYRSGGMSLIAEYSSDIKVREFSTAAHKNSSRMVTSSADATHFVNCKGMITLENCQFESMLDDATNIHGIYMLADTLVSPYIVRASFGHFQQEGNHFAEPGDIIRFVDKSTLKPVGVGKLVSIDRSDRKTYIIETDLNLTETDAPSGLAIENISCNASAIIRGCTVRYNRARSLLLSTLGDVVVENCNFMSQMSGINISGDANFWYESGPTRNIIIRNNRFEDLAIGGNGPMPVLMVDPVIPVKGNDFFYHNNVVFCNNYISTFDSQLIYARSVKSMEISDNKFIDSGTYKPLFPGLSVIDLQSCGEVKISGNDFSQWKSDATISLHKCPNVQDDSGLIVKNSPNPYFERR